MTHYQLGCSIIDLTNMNEIPLNENTAWQNVMSTVDSRK
jgi:hypothetical protein